MLRPAITLSLLLVSAPVARAQQTTVTGASPDAPAKYPPPSSLRITRDLEYARYRDRRLSLDLYLPATESASPLPVIVVVRGGGWHYGDKNGFAFMAGYIASAGFATVCIEYRATEEATFPAAVHDVKAAVRWVRANAARLGLDGTRIGAIGGSAGGQLVAMLATSADEKALEGAGGNAGVSSRVAAVVAMAPVTDFRLTWSAPVGKDGAAFLGAGLKAGDSRLDLASPVTHVSPKSAPLLLMHSRIDSVVPYQQALVLKARYEAMGRPVELVTFSEAPHAFWNYSRWFPEAMAYAINFFRKALH